MKKNILFTIGLVLFFILPYKGYSQSWNQLVSGTTENLNSVHFANDTVGYVAGNNGVLLKTTDGGLTWSDVFNVDTIHLKSIHTIDEDTLYVGGSNRLYKSVDGGANWINLNQNVDITKVYFVTPKHGYYYGTVGINCAWSGNPSGSNYFHLELFETNDYGNTWTNTNLSSFELDNIQFTSDSVGYIVSQDYGCCGIHCSEYWNSIGFKTTDGGNTWQNLSYPSPFYTNVPFAHFLNDTIGYFMIANSLERTIDGSNNYHTIYSGSNNIYSYNAAHFEFVNLYEGYLIRDSTIYMTTSYGVNWNIDYSNNKSLLAADFVDTTCAYVTGQNGLILKKDLNPVAFPDSIKTIEVLPNPLNYGQTAINQGIIKTINIKNTGTLDLEISANSSLDFTIKLSIDSLFNTFVDTFTLAPFQTVDLNVLFNPQNGQFYNDSIFIYSNSNNLPIDTILTTGEGILNGFLGTITNDTTICVDTIRVIGDILVDTGTTVTICPGTVVEFYDNYRITVNGKLIAIGTIQDSITFTWNSNTIKWKSIVLQNNTTDTSYFKYCNIEHSGQSGIYVYQSNIIINNSTVRYNRNGIFLNYSNYGEIKDCYIYDNVFVSAANAYGAGIRSSESNAIISRNHIFNNTISSGSGGGGGIMVHTMTNNKVDILQNLIFNNSSATFKGGGLDLSALDNSQIYLKNNIIVNNEGSNGINCWRKHISSSIKFYNCISRNNSGNQIYAITTNYYPIEVNYSNVEGGFTGIGNIDKNVQFVMPINQIGPVNNLANYDWSLLPSSPCINAGIPDTLGLNIGNVDIIWNNRIYGDTIDIGAYESLAQSPLQEYSCLNNNFLLYTIPFDSTFLGFQWNYNGTPILGENNDSLSLTPFNSTDEGIYSCEIFYNNDTILGNYSSIQMDSTSPFILTQTLTLGSLSLGDSIYMYVDTYHANSFQWYLNNNIIPGATDSVLIVNSISESDTGFYYCRISNGCGNILSQPITALVIGIETYDFNSKVKVYPNPTSNDLYIINEHLKIDDINIIDLTGKSLIYIKQKTNILNISKLPKGVYFIELNTDKGRITKKIVKL